LPIKKKQHKEVNLPVMAVSMALVLFGLIMSFIQDLARTPAYIQASLTRVNKPERPDFAQYNQLLKTFAKDGRVDYQKSKSQSLTASGYG
jgi:hypothetical protein